VLQDEDRGLWPLGKMAEGREAILETAGARLETVGFEVENEVSRRSTFQAIEEFGVGPPVKVKLEPETVRTSCVTSAIPDRPRTPGKEWTRTELLARNGAMAWSSGTLSRVTRSCPFSLTAMFSIHVPRGNS